MALLAFTKFGKLNDATDVDAAGTLAGSPSNVAGASRFGEAVLRTASTYQGDMNNPGTTTGDSTIIFGLVFRIVEWNAVGGAQSLVDICTTSNTTYHMRLYVTPDGRIELRRQSATAVSFSAVNVLKQMTWHYLEFRAVLTDTGSCEVKVDGVSVINEAGPLDFRNGSGTAQPINIFRINNSSGMTVDLDTLYIINESAVAPNTSPGDIRIDSIVPTSDFSGSWTPNSGTTKYTQVDDAVGSEDGSSTYISDGGAGGDMLFGFSTFSPVDMSGSPLWVCNDICGFQSGGTGSFVGLLQPVSTKYTVVSPLNSAAFTSVFGWRPFVSRLNPETSAAWTTAEINATKFGIRGSPV